MMAQLLGLSLEGEYTDDDKPGMGPSPFPVVLDELAYYATTGLDAMLSQGRGLNVSFMLAFRKSQASGRGSASGPHRSLATPI